MRAITNKRICESCGTTDGGGSDQKLLECAGCLSSYFCNTQCQQQSWPLHKTICRQRKKSVVKIQSTWRGWYTRRQLELNDGQDRCEVCGALDSKDKQLNICNGCKLSLFCSLRCQEYAWKKKNHKIICQQRQMIIQLKSVVKIQSSWRGYMCRLAVTKCKETAILKIQTAWKASMKRKRDKIRLKKLISRKLHKKSRQRAALKIQSAWRAATSKNRQTTTTSNEGGTTKEYPLHLKIGVLAVPMGILSIASRYTFLILSILACLVIMSAIYASVFIYDPNGFLTYNKRYKDKTFHTNQYFVSVILATIGTFCMYKGRGIVSRSESSNITFDYFAVFDEIDEMELYCEWSNLFWFGETAVLCSMVACFLESAPLYIPIVLATTPLLTLCFKGKFSRYAVFMLLLVLINGWLKKEQRVAEEKIMNIKTQLQADKRKKKTFKGKKKRARVT